MCSGSYLGDHSCRARSIAAARDWRAATIAGYRAIVEHRVDQHLQEHVDALVERPLGDTGSKPTARTLATNHQRTLWSTQFAGVLDRPLKRAECVVVRRRERMLGRQAVVGDDNRDGVIARHRSGMLTSGDTKAGSAAASAARHAERAMEPPWSMSSSSVHLTGSHGRPGREFRLRASQSSRAVVASRTLRCPRAAPGATGRLRRHQSSRGHGRRWQ